MAETTKTPEATVYAALIKAQQQMGPVLTNATNPHFKSKYADLPGVIETVMKPLHDHGLTVIQRTDLLEGQPVLVTVLAHQSGATISSTYPLRAKDLDDPQKLGASLTYARRYSLMVILGIAPEDDDGNLASAPTTPRPAAQPAPQRTPSRPAPDAADQPCEHPGCTEVCAGEFVGFSQRTYGKAYCRKHSYLAKKGELGAKENMQPMSAQQEVDEWDSLYQQEGI